MYPQIFRLALSCLLSCVLAPALHAADSPPPVMLATSYEAGVDVQAYWVSEKLDGVRGRWDGRRLWTRGGHEIDAPAWFTAGWPRVPMDGELWMGRGRFDEVSGVVRARDADDTDWRRVKFMVFDLPAHGGPFQARVLHVRSLLGDADIAWLQPVRQFQVGDVAELDGRLDRIVDAGGEGLMLHHRDSIYRNGRSELLVKYKRHDDAEARVIAHLPGKGKYEGMVGSLLVERADGVRFRLGSGLSDAQRAEPPPIGAWVTYRHDGFTSKGLPRFARFLRVRHGWTPEAPE